MPMNGQTDRQTFGDLMFLTLYPLATSMPNLPGPIIIRSAIFIQICKASNTGISIYMYTYNAIFYKGFLDSSSKKG